MTHKYIKRKRITSWLSRNKGNYWN